ncbi:NUDIX domain-containing protein [Coprococcus catus]|jgi:NAD+ diphosphatase|uniref:NAD(+) diphosphatase n=1 Tax=Coprococcus catus TaxID=116085 RepID=A0A3E2TRR2_9FIRM|nr:NUDIX domain-containing protein [Coprococcus catus]RGB80862.1 NUDIX domain-containing protein [Coprococcus catus]
MMNYCMECGTKLELRHLENEGEIPFCSQCNQFRFPIFNTAVSMICIDVKNQKILLIKQYGRPDYILVAGYISRGEDAEAAVKREVFEETGMTVDRLQFNKTSFFEPSNTLMVNFACMIEHPEDLKVNEEVDNFKWFTFDEARANIKKNSLAERFLLHYLDHLAK